MKNLIKIILALIFILNISINSHGIEINHEYDKINSDIIYVDDDNINGPWDGTFDNPFKSINEAIKNSTDGYIIYVFNGTYYENILINKSVNLIINVKNIEDIGKILSRGITDNEYFYRVFKESLKETGKI